MDSLNIIGGIKMPYSDYYNDNKIKQMYFREYHRQLDILSRKGYKGHTLWTCARAFADEAVKHFKPRRR